MPTEPPLSGAPKIFSGIYFHSRNMAIASL